MSKGAAGVLFSLIAIVLCVVLYQVPQPLRGYAVLWLLVVIPLGAWGVSIWGRYVELKTAQLSHKPAPAPLLPEPREYKPAYRLDVVEPIGLRREVG